jgi:uncharacterized membrane protein SpoIIM required for sporulation
MLSWLNEHQTLLWLIAGASLVIFIGTLILIPAIVVRIPPDYFAHEKRPPSRWAEHAAPVRLVMLIVKNVLGAILIVAGTVMLGLPGQGLLTMFVGFLLIDFPGKYRFERWLVSRRSVLRLINWLRHRAGRDPLIAGSR